MATGRIPFEGANLFELFNRIRLKQPTRVRQHNPGIPAKLERVIDKLLEKKLENRFSDARKLEAFLSQYSAHLQSPTTHREPKLGRSIRLKPWHYLGIATLLTSLIVVAFLLFNSNWRGPARNTDLQETGGSKASASGQHSVKQGGLRPGQNLKLDEKPWL